PDVDEARENIRRASVAEKFFSLLRISWIKQQQMLSNRDNVFRRQMRAILLGEDEQKKLRLTVLYRRYNKRLLPGWRLIGPNAHTIAIIGAFFFQKFFPYVLLFDYVLFNVVILVMNRMQQASDQKLAQ